MTKRATVTVVMLLTVLSVAPIAAQRKVAELEVTLDKDRYVLHETVSGTVVNLAPGENFTLELTDSYGRAVLSRQLRRVGVVGQVARFAKEKPENVASLLQTWLVEEID